jgi:autotransporter-associated beta strand protein
LLDVGQIELAYADDANGATGADATLNLNKGGTIKTSFIRSASDSGIPASSIMNFDGGLLQAKASSTSFIANSAASAIFKLNVKSGGAVIDTNGHNDTIVPTLGYAADGGDVGGLLKLGEGELTLTADPVYKGDTFVNEGALTVGNLNTPSATVTVATDATLNAASIVADSLVIGAPAVSYPAPVVSGAAVVVPEPSTLVLLALAGMGALVAVWRRK